MDFFQVKTIIDENKRCKKILEKQHSEYADWERKNIRFIIRSKIYKDLRRISNYMPRKLQLKNSGNRFYVSDEKHLQYIDTIIQRALNGLPTDKGKEHLPKISEDDVNLIKEFISEVQAVSHITLKRAYKYTYILVHWRAFIGEFRKNAIADLYKGITVIQNAKNEGGNPKYARHTLADYVGFLKRFYLWMRDSGYTSIDERKIKKIKPPAITLMTKTAEQLLTEEEVRKMIDACNNSRDRAILATMYEGGFRIGEIATMRWRQVKFNEWNCAVNVDNKTRKPRYVPLVMARSFLATWRNDYPLQLTEDAFVFLTLGQHEQLQYRGFVKQLEKIAYRAGVTKHISPHIFRHSRITHLIQQGFGESKIKLMMWGDINTDMFQCYAHLSNNDIDAEVAQHAGISLTTHQKKSTALEPRQCITCYHINEPTVKFCGNCGSPLDKEAADKLREAREQAQLLPEYSALLEEFKTKLLQLQSGKVTG